MKINEYTTEVRTIQTPTGMVSGRLHYETHKVEEDSDTEGLVQVFAEGVDIIFVNDKYVIIKKFIASKIAVGKNE